MIKKIVTLVLCGSMLLGVAGCAKPMVSTPEVEKPAENNDAEKPEDNAEASETESTGGDYKIGILTGTVSQGEEEYRAAENLKAKYGDKIITATYPDNFMKEQETTISQAMTIAADPDVKAIVFLQAVPGASAAIDKVREKRPEILFIAGVPGEDPSMIAAKADIVLQTDDLGMGVSIAEQAKKMGAETLVHYSFPRHMSYEMLAKRRDILKKTSEEIGLKFVEATAPDPTGDAGVPGAQQFILEDVPVKVAEYGEKTAFFNTNCSMQEPLIKSILAEGAILPQQCCPSPYHGYPGALGIEIPEDKKGDVAYITEAITKVLEDKGGTGRFATWPVPVNMLFVEAGVEYAMAFAEGKVDRNDGEYLTKLMKELVGGDVKISNYKEEDTVYENYYLLLSDYVTF